MQKYLNLIIKKDLNLNITYSLILLSFQLKKWYLIANKNLESTKGFEKIIDFLNQQLKKNTPIDIAEVVDKTKLSWTYVKKILEQIKKMEYIGYHFEKDRSIYFIFNTSLGYYDLNALPIIIWVEETLEPQGSFLRYRTSPKEELEYSDDASDPKWLNIPIVNFKILPDFLKVWW